MGRRYANSPREEISKEALLYGELPYERSQPQRSAAVTSQIEALLNWLSSKRIMIPQPAETRTYLLRYPDIMNILPFICKAASERFEMHSQLSLEVYHDPEMEDKYLTFYVRQNRYDEHILDIIEDICAEYEEELADKLGWLLVLDFGHFFPIDLAK